LSPARLYGGLPKRQKTQKGAVLMSNYESTIICSPEAPPEKLEEIVQKIKKIVETSQGVIGLTQQLGKKKLAYPIKKFREGSYIYFELSGPGEMIASLENFYRINDFIIRYLTIKPRKKKVKKPAVEKETTAPEEVKTDGSNNYQAS
jgi:small subunit ribosomal protein S6